LAVGQDHGTECRQAHGLRTVPAGRRRDRTPRLGISSHSNHKALAFDAVRCLTQTANQKTDAIKGGLAPVAASIYGDAAFDKAYPFHSLIKAQLQTYGLRPQTPAYADVTLAIQKALSPTSGIQPSSVVSKLRNEIKLSLSSEALL
jgi:multiple sugar transport system substrate-binding protein